MPTSARGTWLAAIFVVLVLGSIGAYLVRDGWSWGDGMRLEVRGEPPASVAVLPLDNAAGDADEWVRWGLSTVLAETLDRTPGLRVTEPDRLAKALGERGLAGPGSDRPRLRELAVALGAELVVDATFRRDQLGVRLDVELFDDQGDVLARKTYEAPDALQAAERLVRDVGTAMVPGYEPLPIRRALSGDPFYDRLYATGIQAQLAGHNIEPRPLAAPRGSRAAAEAATEQPASDREALGRALTFFDMAVRDKPDFLLARLRRIDCLRESRRLDEMRGAAEALLQEAQSKGAFDLLAHMFRELGRLEALEGNAGAAEVQLREAHRLSLAQGDEMARAAVLVEMSRLALAEGSRERAEELLVEVLSIREQGGDQLGRIDVLLSLGNLMLTEGDPDGASSLLNQALVLAKELRDPWTENRAAASLGEVAARRGRPLEAVEFWSQALRFYRGRGDDDRVLLLSRKLAETLLVQTQWKRSEEHFMDVLELARKRGDEFLVARASVHLAWLQLKLGFPFQAEDHLHRALEYDRHLQSRDRLQRVIAWFAYEQGNRQLALETQEEIFRQCQAKGCWNRVDQAFLEVFRLAAAEDRRLPLPGEAGGPAFPSW